MFHTTFLKCLADTLYMPSVSISIRCIDIWLCPSVSRLAHTGSAILFNDVAHSRYDPNVNGHRPPYPFAVTDIVITCRKPSMSFVDLRHDRVLFFCCLFNHRFHWSILYKNAKFDDRSLFHVTKFLHLFTFHLVAGGMQNHMLRTNEFTYDIKTNAVMKYNYDITFTQNIEQNNEVILK